MTLSSSTSSLTPSPRPAALSFRWGQDPIYGSFFQQSSFASLTLATARNTMRVPDEVPLDILAAFPCGVNTGAGAVMHVLKPQPGDSYVAFGTGDRKSVV